MGVGVGHGVLQPWGEWAATLSRIVRMQKVGLRWVGAVGRGLGNCDFQVDREGRSVPGGVQGCEQTKLV